MKIPMVELRVVREAGVKYDARSRILTPGALYWFVRPMIEGLCEERFFAIHLNSQSRPISIQEISRGMVNLTMAHPREVFRGAIAAGAVSIACAHNHPSGDPTPSRDDIALTKRLVDAGRIVGIPMIDHLVVTEDEFASIDKGD